MEISRKKETGQDLKRRGRGREGQTEAKTEGQERSRVMVRWRPGLGDNRAGWRPRLEGRGRLPLGESGKGARGAGARPTPHIPHPPRRPASPSGRGQRVRSGRTCVRGAAGREPVPRPQGPEGPGGTAGSRGPPHTWAARPPPARPGLRGRGGAAEARRGGVGGRLGEPAGARGRGWRARLPLPVSGPHCRG